MERKYVIVVATFISLVIGWLAGSHGVFSQMLGAAQRERPGLEPKKEAPAAGKPYRFGERGESGWLLLRGAGESSFDKGKKVGYEIIRDRETGTMLYFITETGAVAAAPTTKTFQMVQVEMKAGGREMIRYNALTGEAWMRVVNDWVKLPENGTAPEPGDYKVFMAEGANNTFYANRFDHVTGRTWNLTAGKWEDMPVK